MRCIGAANPTTGLKFFNGRATIEITGPSAVWASSVVTLTLAAININGTSLDAANPTVTFS